MIRLLQFTDLHLRDDPQSGVRGVATQQSFEAVLYHARERHWPPDAVLLTGDIANDEFDHSYARIAAMVNEWRVPTIAVPGNHDDGARLRAAFDRIPNAARQVLDFERWRVVGLDSQVPGAVHGELDDATYRMLDEAGNTRGNRHLLVCLHHHPLDVDSEFLRDLGLRNAEAFRGTLERLNAAACVFGHIHHEWEREVNGVRYLATPSTGRQFEAGAKRYAESDKPPAYRWLTLHDDGGIDTGVATVEVA